MDMLGKLSFLDTPDVNTDPVLVSNTGVVSFSADVLANRPAAGLIGRVFLTTDTNRLYYDDGAIWVDTTQIPLIDGTANQIDVVDGTNVTPTVISIASNPIIPGTERMRPPVGTTAQRPVSPAAGDMRYNSTLNWTEEYNGAAWSPMGRVIQVRSGNIVSSTGTSQMVLDNTVPTATEGHEIWTLSFTPILATSRIVIEYVISVAGTANPRVVLTQVRYGANCIGAVGTNMTVTNNVPNNLAVRVAFAPGSTATQTISARAGMTNSGTLSVNAWAGNNLGGAMVTQFTISEVI